MRSSRIVRASEASVFDGVKGLVSVETVLSISAFSFLDLSFPSILPLRRPVSRSIQTDATLVRIDAPALQYGPGGYDDNASRLFCESNDKIDHFLSRFGLPEVLPNIRLFGFRQDTFRGLAGEQQPSITYLVAAAAPYDTGTASGFVYVVPFLL